VRNLRIVLVAVLLLVAAAIPAQAYILPVWDIPNGVAQWLTEYQTLVSMIKDIYAVAQRVQMLYNQYLQIKAEYRQLQSWAHQGEWHNLIGVYGTIEGLLNQVDRLGYQTAGLAGLLDQTFPGLTLPTNWPSDYRRQLSRGIVTQKELMNVLDHLSRMNMKSQLRLVAIQDRIGRSDGVVESLQSLAMVNSLAAEDTGRILQASLVDANINALIHAHDLQQQATQEMLLEQWVATPHTLGGAETSFNGIPSTWLW